MRNKWIWITGTIILGGIVFSLFVWSSHSQVDAITVSELTSRGELLPGQRLRVEGKVTPASIEWDNQAQVMSFVLTDDKDSLHAVYKGIVPDNFKPGAELIVEGRYSPDGVFEVASFGSRRSLCSFCH